MRLYMVQVDIFEEASGYAYPVTQHRFFGRTPAEARGYHAAHRKADAFLRGCEDKRRFEGGVRCYAVEVERWVSG